jgi:hypothetical protein
VCKHNTMMLIKSPINSTAIKSFFDFKPKLHGRCQLPARYGIIPVPRDATFHSDEPIEYTGNIWQRLSQFILPNGSPRTAIACNYSIVKILVALGQTLFAIATLYETRGNQIDRFGYAAFGLTVTPYAIMSLVNLLGHLICPDYSHMYLVDSSGLATLHRNMPSAESFTIHGAEVFVDGVVGRISAKSEAMARRLYSDSDDTLESTMVRRLRRFLIAVVLFSPLIIIGALTGFTKGSSSAAQRVWTMSWLVFGMSTPIFIELWIKPRYGRHEQVMYFFMLFFLILWSAPAIGGFVVIGEMISIYGVCTKIS